MAIHSIGEGHGTPAALARRLDDDDNYPMAPGGRRKASGAPEPLSSLQIRGSKEPPWSHLSAKDAMTL